MINNKEKMRQYLNKSPKGKLWVTKFGIEKTMKYAKTIFLPIGIIVATTLIVLGGFAFLLVF